MQRLNRLLVATLVVLIGAAAPGDSRAQQVSSARIDRARVIVKLKDDSAVAREKSAQSTGERGTRAKLLARSAGLAMRDGIALSDREQVVMADGITSEALARRLSLDENVEYAVPDGRLHILAVPNDPLYASAPEPNGPAAGQWYLRAPAGEVKASIDAETAWSATSGSPTIVVAVVDTGVRFEHPDLRTVSSGGNLLGGYDMVSDARRANDGDGRDPDASDPGDWLTDAELSQSGSALEGCNENASNSSWHGTKTAGLIAALTNDGIGMASVGRTVRILPVRAVGKCGGYDSDVIAGMRWAAGIAIPGVPNNTNPARVINVSLGDSRPCNAAYQAAVDQIVVAGAVVVAAAGNSAGHAVWAPANCRGVIAVAGLRHAGTKVGFSDLGREIAIAAPAGNCVNVEAGLPCLYPILTTSNGGATTPGASIYTDSFNWSVGTSFAAPLVSGTIALMLSVQPSLTPSDVRLVLQSTARPFPTTGAAEPVTGQCTVPRYDVQGDPIDQLECYCTTTTCGAGMLDAGTAVLAAKAGLAYPGIQAQGLWWNAPGGSESGWGLNVAQQADVIFATWFTYSSMGNAWWLSMTANRVSTNVYAGLLYETHGPPFNSGPFDPSRVMSTQVGSGTLTFSDADHGTFRYTVNGITQTKPITRQVFGALPVCTFGLHPSLDTATNYQDLWWNAPPGSESGWGINLTHQGSVIFATWFTYDASGNPTWLSATANSVAPNAYAGTLYRSSGPPFNASPFNPANVAYTAVGNATLSFADGNNAAFAYTVDGISQTKAITRQVFRAPGTVCN
ncbi:MAG TPA: S8 family peptidase [Casimicrobiaceae bacterium]|nr:S8 family peptidase [Casimicrobiaceae bacterium]